jgi:magnesium chelatase family protein
MNPSPDGYYKDPEIECTNSLAEIKRYQSKISGPLMDRIDMILEIPREKVEKILDTEKQETSADVREKVIDAWRRQEARFSSTDIVCNADISAKNIDTYIPLSKEVKDFLTQAAQKLYLSGRVVHRTMKLARTIADYM